MAKIKLQHRILYDCLRYEGDNQELEDFLGISFIDITETNILTYYYNIKNRFPAIFARQLSIGDCIITDYSGVVNIIEGDKVLDWDRLWRVQDKDYYLEMK